MLRWLSRLRLSLATKCQLLFGTAAGVIILAALAVAWQRIGQLTEAQNRIAADVLADQTLATHIESGDIDPARTLELDGARVRAPRIVAADAIDRLTPFEQAALRVFRERADRRAFREDALLPDADGQPGQFSGTRTAIALHAQASCLSCHAGPDAVAPIVVPFEGGDETEPQLMGVMSIELASQTSTRELLLNRSFLITAAITSAGAATLTLYLILTRLILTPVRVLQDVAERVRGGDLNVRAEVASGDEFETLARTVNEMVANLQTRNTQLARANRSLDKRLGDLAEANVALDESNRIKSEFLANVSHELRTPLNSILGFADLVSSAGGTDKVDRYAGNIKKSGQALLELINDLLDLAKIEAGKMEVRTTNLSLADVFEALGVLMAPIANRRQVRIVSEVGPRVPIMETDGGKLQQILYNLLSNAIKFSDTGGRVDLVARRELDDDGESGDYVRITVTDQGPGIAEESQEAIFEKFKQLDASATREHGGTGLGLAISRELADLLRGELSVSSTPGQGATFIFRLPVAFSDAPASAAASANGR
ncbi:MAG: ATP-binding protein [Planctomycetota bacterium]